jgi:site-specific DNA-methyltransferase (adenine-specific)
LLGDNLAALPTFPDDCADLVQFSPPYFQKRKYNGLGSGNEGNVKEHKDYLLKLFAECIRVVKPTGVVIVNLGDLWIDGSQQLLPYQFALAVLERFPVKLINDVTWAKPNGLPKAHAGKWLANHKEQFFVFAKTDDYYFDPEPFRAKKAARDYAPTARLGQGYREKIDTSDLSDSEKRNAHHELDILIKEVKDGKIEGFRMRIRSVHALPWRGMDKGGIRKMMDRGFHVMRLRGVPAARNFLIHATDSRKGGYHPAVYPVDLAEKFVRGFCPVDGIVVDPCMGSGSTALAGLNSGRDYIGIDIDPLIHADSVKTVEAHAQSRTQPHPHEIDAPQDGRAKLCLPTIARPIALFRGDCLDVLLNLPDNSVDSALSDSPFHLTTNREMSSQPEFVGAPHRRFQRGFMNSTWDAGEISFRSETWARVLRVLKPGGHLLAFGGTRTAHRMAAAIEDAGFEIRDMLIWVFGTGFPKSQKVSRFIARYFSDRGEPIPDEMESWQGWGSGLKPGQSPIYLFRKPLSEPTIAANVIKWGTGALNIDANRVPLPKGGKLLDGLSGRSGTSLDTNGQGWKFKSVDREAGLGRFPANVIHDGSEPVVRLLGPAAKFFPSYFESENEVIQRLIYMSKATRRDRNGSRHPCVKPVKLLEWLLKLITPPGATALDPFAGTGPTGEAAMNLGMKVILIEKEPEYHQDCLRRLKRWL